MPAPELSILFSLMPILILLGQFARFWRVAFGPPASGVALVRERTVRAAATAGKEIVRCMLKVVVKKEDKIWVFEVTDGCDAVTKCTVILIFSPKSIPGPVYIPQHDRSPIKSTSL
jgi:hypothetical protein